MLGTPLPEDAEVPFVSSLQGTKARSMSLHNKSSALESFMKFDRKYTRVSFFGIYIVRVVYIIFEFLLLYHETSYFLLLPAKKTFRAKRKRHYGNRGRRVCVTY